MFLKTTTMCKLAFKPFKSEEELLWIFKVINIQSWSQIHRRLQWHEKWITTNLRWQQSAMTWEPFATYDKKLAANRTLDMQDGGYRAHQCQRQLPFSRSPKNQLLAARACNIGSFALRFIVKHNINSTNPCNKKECRSHCPNQNQPYLHFVKTFLSVW